MKERPVLFQPDMVRAILDGRKTMTRRIMKPQPKYWQAGYKDPLNWKKGTVSLYWWEKNGVPARGCTLDEYLPFCPYGQPGDILWVREMWSIEHLWPKPHGEYLYKADNPTELNLKWHPSIHMPKEACRLRLRITDVRVEQVQNITREDAIAEGFMVKSIEGKVLDGRMSFAFKWQAINGKESWNANPYVWVIEFERI